MLKKADLLFGFLLLSLLFATTGRFLVSPHAATIAKSRHALAQLDRHSALFDLQTSLQDYRSHLFVSAARGAEPSSESELKLRVLRGIRIAEAAENPLPGAGGAWSPIKDKILSVVADRSAGLIDANTRFEEQTSALRALATLMKMQTLSTLDAVAPKADNYHIIDLMIDILPQASLDLSSAQDVVSATIENNPSAESASDLIADALRKASFFRSEYLRHAAALEKESPDQEPKKDALLESLDAATVLMGSAAGESPAGLSKTKYFSTMTTALSEIRKTYLVLFQNLASDLSKQILKQQENRLKTLAFLLMCFAGACALLVYMHLRPSLQRERQHIRSMKEVMEAAGRSLGIAEFDMDGGILTANRKFLLMMGYDLAEIQGKPHSLFVLPEEAQSLEYRQFWDALRGGAYQAREFLRFGKGGRPIWIHASYGPIAGQDGTPVKVIKFAYDISDRKENEARLAHSTARMKAILETAKDAIITINDRGLIQSCNRAGCQMFGYAPDELIGRNIRMLMPSPYQENHDGYLESYLKTGVTKVIGIGRRVEGLKKNGAVFPIELAVTEVETDGERLFTGFVRDLSAQKAAEIRA